MKPKPDYVTKRQILRKLCGQMNGRQTITAPADWPAMKNESDVIVRFTNQTVLFEPQNSRASEWLHRRCHLNTENVNGDTEIRVHPSQCRRIVDELKAAGFNVVS